MTDLDAAARQRRFLQRFMDGVPHLKLMGILYRDHGTDWAELEMPFAPQQLADPDYGIIASGAIFTLLDNAAGFAVLVARGEMSPHATLDMRVDYLRGPAPQATVIGRAECYRLTRQIAFVRGVAHDGDPANPIANMAGTFMFTARPEAATA
ncbi:MAG: PaaI family thioesterase [Polymorphobacter sp.]